MHVSVACMVSLIMLFGRISSFRIPSSLRTTTLQRLYSSDSEKSIYSLADQKKRQAKAVSDANQRVLNIDSIYDPSYLKGKTVLVSGGNRGLGLAIVKELMSQGCKKVYATSRQPVDIPGAEVISGIDVTDDKCGDKLVAAIADNEIDLVINNAGYFYQPLETLETLNFAEQLKMIDICALGILRVTAPLVNNNKISNTGKVALITSQGGSISWRFIQNPTGHDYGHHMSKAAANMAGVLLAQELRSRGIPVIILHPGFNKTDMTAKYASIWEEEGAVDSSVGAKRVLQEIGQLTMDKTGLFINCEDGLQIPF
jgi:NAD(P)-dependent dehydrogenase (short-subunit alcohol dehydrogenase family)